MARITVEDCIDKVPNRYELVLLAACRARLIAHGSPATVDTGRDKAAIVALREIAQGAISADDLRQALIHSLQYNVEVDEPDASAAPLLEGQGQHRSGSNEEASSPGELTEEQLLEAMQKLLPADRTASDEERPSGLDSPKEE